MCQSSEHSVASELRSWLCKGRPTVGVLKDSSDLVDPLLHIGLLLLPYSRSRSRSGRPHTGFAKCLKGNRVFSVYFRHPSERPWAACGETTRDAVSSMQSQRPCQRRS